MKSTSFLKSLRFALEGIIHTLKTQRNMRIHFFAAIIVLIASLVFKLSAIEIIMVIFAITLVIFAELINTAIEATIDVTTTTADPIAKIAKDAAAGAVLVASVNAVLIGYIIFFQRINSYIIKALENIERISLTATLIALTSIIAVVLAYKILVGRSGSGKNIFPIIYSAVAGALFTSITLISSNIFISFISFILVVMVFQSKTEKKIHGWFDTLSGALLGVIVTFFVFQVLYF